MLQLIVHPEPAMPALPVVLAIAIGVFETTLSLSRRAKSHAVSHDRGSLRLFWVLIPLAIWLGFLLAARYPQAQMPATSLMRWLGTAIVAAGLTWRWYAIRYLGKWFTVNVAIAHDQPLIQDGPYRYLRHPSYTGAVMALLGLSLALANALALLALLIVAAPAFLHRIQIEEAALANAFGARWLDYRKRTKRLIPGIY